MRSPAPRGAAQSVVPNYEANAKEHQNAKHVFLLNNGKQLCPINELRQDTRKIGNYKSLCPVKLDGHSTFALVDSGNVVTNAISLDFAKRLFSGRVHENVTPLSYRFIGTADKKGRLPVSQNYVMTYDPEIWRQCGEIL